MRSLKNGGSKVATEGSLIIVDGIVGIGKTSLVDLLNKKLDYQVFPEVFSDENDLLGKYYREGKKWCFPMQVNFLSNRFSQYKQAVKIQSNIVMDRSIYSDPIFAELYLQNGDLDTIQYQVYRELFDNLTESLRAPDLLIFLECSIEEVIRRIRDRGRPDERFVDDKYWKKLNKLYNEYYQFYTKSSILRIDVTDLDFVNNEEHSEMLVNLINIEIKKSLDYRRR